MANIISVSRRTDIPAFYSDWFMNRIKAGYCKYQPPMNPEKKVSLGIDDVLAFVFWSRNYGPMIKKGHFDILKNSGYDFFLHFTIVDYPKELDPDVIDADIAVEQYQFLAERFGKDSISWRFDPVIFSSFTTIKERLHTFEKLTKLLGPYTDRCTISIMDLYKKTVSNMGKRGIRCYDPYKNNGPVSYNDLGNALRTMVEIADRANIELYTCCEKEIRENRELGIKQGHCIDKLLLAAIIRDKKKREITLNLPGDTGQRKKFDCGCFKSIDIGIYDTCIHGCLYCYANTNKEVALRNYRAHNSNAEIVVNKIKKGAATLQL